MRPIQKPFRFITTIALVGLSAGGVAGFLRGSTTPRSVTTEQHAREYAGRKQATTAISFDKTVLPKGQPSASVQVAVRSDAGSTGRADALRGQLGAAVGERDAAKRRQRLAELGKLAARLDPAEVTALAAGLSPDDRAAFLTGVVTEMVRTNPEEGLRFATSEKSLSLRSSLTALAIAALAERDPAAAGRWLTELPPGAVRDRAMASFIQAWSATDPAAAADWLMSLTDDRIGRAEATGMLMRGWVERDPGAAAAWAIGLPAGPERSGAVASLMESWAERAPLEAARWAEQQIGTAHEHDAIGNLASRWGYADPESAMDWLTRLPNPLAHSADAAAVMSYLAESQPSRAVELAAALPPGMQQTAINSIAGTWSAMDPDIALQWVDTISDAQARSDAYRSAVEMWTMRSPEEVLAFIDGQPVGQQRDAAIAAYTNPGAHADLTPLLDLALTISDPQTRADRVEFLYGQLHQSNPDAASRWLTQSQLPGDLRQRLG